MKDSKKPTQLKLISEYNPAKIEPKWQKVWEKKQIYAAKDFGKNTSGISSVKHKKFYSLIEFPFPSGEGLHVGHIRSNVAMDIISRKRRMEGYNVLYPIGWDSFGLPTEQYAIKTGIHPTVVTRQNTKTFERQLRSIGFSFDWKRKVDTSDPLFYRWTQWMFLELFKHGVAYQKETEVWWCEALGTVLANEEVIDGKSERGNFPCVRRPLPQWMVAITRYAERLYNDLDLVSYPDVIKNQIRNWIGKSEGAEIQFEIAGNNKKFVKVFTTRPDTLFGVTYVVLAPENPLVSDLKDQIKNWKEVHDYKEKTKSKSELERTGTDKTKTGLVLEGVFATHPITKEKVPVWIADYVLNSYGTGAVMAVPSHDERDAEFAQKFNLPFRVVVEPITGEEKPNEEFRQSIVVIVINKKTNKVLTIDWGSLGGTIFIGGGIEKGEDVVKCAIREIKEETGYINIKHILTSEKIHHHYFAHSKKVARNIDATGLFFELENEEKTEIKLEENEKEKFTVQWKSYDEAETIVKDPLHSYLFKKFIRNKAYSGVGILTNSGVFSGKKSNSVDSAITKLAGGKMVTTYKLRDWVFSRQRYWGEPFPIVWVGKEAFNAASSIKKSAVAEAMPKEQVKRIRVITDKKLIDFGKTVTEYALPIPPQHLPLILPKVKSFAPKGDGQSALGTAASWVHIYFNIRSGETLGEKDFIAKQKKFEKTAFRNKNKKTAHVSFNPNDWFNAMRETDTMPNWAGSSWYYLRYVDPLNNKTFADKKNLNYWTPVDWYNGGMEHNTLHILYSRFWHKFLYDIGAVPTVEPYTKRTSHGVILAEDGTKMSKSVGNVINPDVMIKNYGADTLRMYQMFMGPFDQTIAWNSDSMSGVRRFIEKVWRMIDRVSVSEKDSEATEVIINQSIKKVSEDIESMGFNTAVSQLMILANHFEKLESISIDAYIVILKLLSPFAPHVTDELWEILKTKKLVKKSNDSIHETMWPDFDPKKITESTVTIVIQINGKHRGEIKMERGSDNETLIKTAFALPTIIEKLQGLVVKKTIAVKDRLVNIVV